MTSTWTLRTSAANYAWRGVTYGAGLFVAVASSGTGNRVMTSPDGITWTLGTSAADNSWRGVTYGAGLFVAVADSGTGNRVMTSPDGSMVAPSITGFSIPVKTYGDAPFPITQPTSNSTGAFTYISDNSSVATINGSTITIVGPGQATITATQAATPNYLSGTIQTTLLVNQSTLTNPVILSSEDELLYFFTTSARYATLTQTMEIKSVVNLTDVYTFL